MALGDWTYRHRWGLAVGVTATVVGCAVMAAGWLRRLDDFGLDLHFRHVGTMGADPRIVLIDIDDRALETVPESWPWPRRTLAEAIDLLRELQSETVIVDLVFDTPDAPRLLATTPTTMKGQGDLESENDVRAVERPIVDLIHDDDELAAAIARHGNVILPFFFETNEALSATSAVLDSLTAKLTGNFALTAEALAAEFQQSDLRQWYPEAKRRAARELAAVFVKTNSESADKFRTFVDSVFRNPETTASPADIQDLSRALEQALAEREYLSRCPLATSTGSNLLPTGHSPTYPIAKFVRSAKHLGFVGWDRQLSGPVLRELSLAAKLSGHVSVQLGLQAALEALALDATSLRTESGEMKISSSTMHRRWPIDAHGRALLNWHRPASGNWSDSFVHVPITRLLEITFNRRQLVANRDRLRSARERLLYRRHESTPAEFNDYVRMDESRRRLVGELRRTTDADSIHELTGELKSIEAELTQRENEAFAWLQWRRGLQLNDPAKDDDGTNDATAAQHNKQIAELAALLLDGSLDKEIAGQNERIGARNAALLAELKPLIESKVCFVGYTASAQADIVATPVHDAMPGVMVHANIVNMLLQDRPVRRSPLVATVGLMGALGVIVTIMGCARGAVVGLTSLTATVAMLIAAAAMTFARADWHVPSLAISAALFIVWASVTLCRQLTEERARRRFQAALAQYTAPAVAARIAEAASVADLAPRSAVVTCFFADLQGFTTLSERLGPEKTQRVLNPYLKTISAVLIKHGAMVNKFMGDGVFAFFNAPILRCDDHAIAACRCALEAVSALNELNRRVISKEIGGEFRMRIGLSTGEVFVGDYGSDNKLDYTCIGDVVNVAGRLQAANKELGTTILINEATYRAAANRFETKSVGALNLAGKTVAVQVWELRGENRG